MLAKNTGTTPATGTTEGPILYRNMYVVIDSYSGRGLLDAILRRSSMKLFMAPVGGHGFYARCEKYLARKSNVEVAWVRRVVSPRDLDQ